MVITELSMIQFFPKETEKMEKRLWGNFCKDFFIDAKEMYLKE